MKKILLLLLILIGCEGTELVSELAETTWEGSYVEGKTTATNHLQFATSDKVRLKTTYVTDGDTFTIVTMYDYTFNSDVMMGRIIDSTGAFNSASFNVDDDTLFLQWSGTLTKIKLFRQIK